MALVPTALILAGLAAPAALRPSPGRRGGAAKRIAAVLCAILAVYLMGRGVAEFFVVNYSNAASYRDSWGGPSLVGVFLVHSGPGAVVVLAIVGYLLRWWPASRRTTIHRRSDRSHQPVRTPGSRFEPPER